MSEYKCERCQSRDGIWQIEAVRVSPRAPLNGVTTFYACGAHLHRVLAQLDALGFDRYLITTCAREELRKQWAQECRLAKKYGNSQGEW